jgi:hypothetical protein
MKSYEKEIRSIKLSIIFLTKVFNHTCRNKDSCGPKVDASSYGGSSQQNEIVGKSKKRYQKLLWNF